MRIIPVIDLMHGKAVHAVAGKRERYTPVKKSVLVRHPSTLSIAKALQGLGLEELYIADLDAICQIGHNHDLIGQIVAETGMKVMVDAGFRFADEVSEYVDEGVEKIVLATETLESFEEIPKVINDYKAQVMASIDIKSGQVIAESDSMQVPLAELIRKFEDKGASEIIILSLDRVGTERGPDLESLKLALQCKSMPILVGGGVRDIKDVHLLCAQGAAGILVSTALHKGIITKNDLGRLSEMEKSSKR